MTVPSPRPRALTIAGSDSGGGAGVQADLKTFEAFGVFGTSAIVALTAQNSLGVRAVHAAPPEFVIAQIDAVLDDIGADAIKTGMLADAPRVEAVARALERRRDEPGARNLVVDPVMIATSGDPLLEPEAIALVRSRLLPLAAIVTPNLPEVRALLGFEPRDRDEMERAARALVESGARAALVKGGHLRTGVPRNDERGDGEGARPAADSPDALCVRLASGALACEFVEGERVDSENTHGSGCTLSAAIAAGLARGAPMREAVRDAKAFVTEGIRRSWRPGAGPGPLAHREAGRILGR